MVVVCAVAGLPLKQMFNRFKNIYSEVGSWLRGCGSRLQIVEAAAKLVLKCLQRSCRDGCTREVVRISYDAGEEAFEQNGMVGVLLL